MISRRSLLGVPQSGAGEPGTASAARPARRASAPPGLNPIKASEFGYEQARHLLWRAGFGGTPQQIQTLVGWGSERAVDFLLDGGKGATEPVKQDLFDKDIMRPPTEAERQAYRMAQKSQNEDEVAKFRKLRQDREREDRAQVNEMQKWWLRRMIETARPLEEKMTLFWHGHFATSYRTIENSYHMFVQNEMFRKHATGNFANLLFGIIRDPAMIAYLNNNESRKGHANENLAREIMELFSLGVGAYSESDIKEGARALTGYTFKDDEFTFVKANHDDGVKSILGKKGKLDGDDFVRTILEQRACSRFVARKLYSFFVNDLPPVERLADKDMDPGAARAVAGLADTLLQNKYELRPVLRKLFLSEHFYDTRFESEQVKSPVTLVVGAVRSLNTPVRRLDILNDALDLMGQNLLFPPSVKGWEGGRSWINTSTMFVRQNILTYLLTGKQPVGYDANADSERYDPMPLLEELARVDPGAASDAGRVVEYLMRLTLGRVSPSAREPLMAFMAKRSNAVTADTVTALLLLITAMPEYQLC